MNSPNNFSEITRNAAAFALRAYFWPLTIGYAAVLYCLSRFFAAPSERIDKNVTKTPTNLDVDADAKSGRSATA